MHFCCREKKKRISFWLRWTTKSRDETIYRDYFHPAHTHTCSHTHTRTLMHLSLATHMHSHFLRSTHSLSLIHSFSLFLSSIQNRRSRACCMPYPLSLSHTHTHTHALTAFLRRIFVIDLVRQMRANFIPLDLLSRFIRAYLSLSLSLFHTHTHTHTHSHTHSLSLFMPFHYPWFLLLLPWNLFL